jgi:hypothetical protein
MGAFQPTASTRPRTQSKSERCPYFSAEATCPRLNRLDSCKKSIYFIAILSETCYTLLFIVTYTLIYNTTFATSAQKAGIPTNPLSPLLFILSSSRLCDRVLSEDAVSFKAPYFRAAVAPLFISYIPSSEKISLQSIQNEETINLVYLPFYLLIED